jgi:hypothetical protein
VAGQRNTTVPGSLRGRYPLHPEVPPPPAPPNPAEVGTPPAGDVRGLDPHTSVEVPGLRDAHSRTYTNADGTQTTQFSASPINFQRRDGSWAPVDPGLVVTDTRVPAGTGPPAAGWRNGADSVDVRLAPYADAADLARLSYDEHHTVGFALTGAAHAQGVADAGSAGSVAGSAAGSATYRDVRPYTDLRFEPVSGGVKENVILKSPDAADTYLFPLRLTGLSAKVTGGRIVLVDAAGRVWAEIPAGYMYDSADSPATSTAVTYQLVSSGGQQALQVTLDRRWLRDPARRFPVTLDPSVERAAADSGMVVRGGSSYSGNTELLVGDQGGTAAASYLKFDGLVSRLRYHKIFGAQLQVLNFDAASCQARPVTVHPVTQSWTAGTGYSYPGPTVGAALASASFAYGYIALGQSRSACPTGQALFNLGVGGRDMVQGWVDGQPNNGLSLRASPTDPLSWKRLAGTGTANPPVLFVTHSPYDAGYAIPNPVPSPPVLQN